MVPEHHLSKKQRTKRIVLVFQLPVQVGRTTSVMNRIEGALDKGFGGYTVAANIEKSLACRKDLVLTEIVQNASFCVADGFPVALAATVKSCRRTSRVNLPVEVLRLASRRQLSVYLLGGTAEVIRHAVSVVVASYGCQVVGYNDGFFLNIEDMVEEINRLSPRVVLVGMGTPKQELFVAQAARKIPGTFFVPCGGALDILAGSKRRAPVLIRKVGLEWLYRMSQEPKRIIRLWNKLNRKQ